jgi:uroporphyrinogen decarboxylase
MTQSDTAQLSGRERMALTLAHQEADRIPRTDSFWPETIPGWYAQGLVVGNEVPDLFDFDIMGAGWITHEARPGFLKTIAEDDRSWTRLDGHGAILRYWKHKSGTPEHVGFTITTRDQWEAHKAEMLAVPPAARVDTLSALRAMHRAHTKGRWFCWTGVECYETAKDIFGHELLSIIMAEDPDWAVDIFETETTIALQVLDHLEASGVAYDGGWVYGDIAYNHGPFFSPRMYRSQIMPAHTRHMAWFKDRGMPVIYHTDGDIHLLIPDLIQAGVDCLQPLEAKARMDVRNLKSQYEGRLTLMGNIDATVLLTNDVERIEEEISSKLLTAKVGGGYIYHSDHSIPPQVTWETYGFIMEAVKRYGRY